MNEKQKLIKVISKIIENHKDLAIEIESLIQKQFISFQIFGEDKSLNEYKKRMLNGTEALLKNESLSDEQRLELSKHLLNLIKFYQDIFIDKNLKKNNNELLAKISEFKGSLKASLLNEEIGIPREFANDLVEWLKLSFETYDICKMMEDSITEQVELDKFFPNRSIKDNGKMKSQVSESEKKEYAESMGTYGALLKVATDKYKGIKEKRNLLTKKIFGDINQELERKLTDWTKKLRSEMSIKKE